MRTRLSSAATVLALGLVLAACGGDPEPTEDPTSAGSESSAPATPSESEESKTPEPQGSGIEITVSGDDIDPKGERVQADLDEPVVLTITSDRAGELHVHSTPEQVVAFTEGTHDYELTFEQPGVVDVEEHDTGVVVVQLQVS